MLNFKNEYFTLEKGRTKYPTQFKDKSFLVVYGSKEGGITGTELTAHIYKIPENYYEINAGQLDFSNYPNGIENDFLTIRVTNLDSLFSLPLNFTDWKDISPENLTTTFEKIGVSILDIQKRLSEVAVYIDSGKPDQINLPKLPVGCTWYKDQDENIVALPISDLYGKFQQMIDKLYDEIKKLTSIYIDTLKNELKKNAEQIINNIAEQKTTMKLQPNITRYKLPSTWIITDKTEVYINGLLISKEMYRIENYELILNDSLSDEADLVVKISLPSTYIEELKNTAKEDIDNYITEKKKELKGDKGTTFKPSVDNLGNLTWSNDDGLPNPPVVNIMGPQGKPGVPGRDGEQGLPGKNGEDGKDLTVEVQGTIGMKFDENLRFLNDVGAKKKGFCYFDKLTDGVFECKENTEITVNDTRYFKNISSKTNSDYINNLFGNVRLYNQDSINIADNLFNTSITKIVGVKLTVEADKFASSDNALVTFNYTKLLKKCCFANLIFTSPRGAWLGSSLENNVNVRLQYIDSVQLVLGVIGNNKREKIDLYLALYGN